MRPAWLFYLAPIVLLTASCSMSKDAELADKAVTKFHSLLDAQKFSDLYNSADDELKKATSEDDFTALLDAISRKLGKIKSTKQQGWNVNYQTSGTFVTLTYQTTFTEGDASERFSFIIRGKQAILYGYHINSTTLVTK